MAISDVEAKAIREAIDQLKGEIAELETRLQQDRILSHHQGSLKSIGIRVLIAAARIDDLLSTLAAKEK